MLKFTPFLLFEATSSASSSSAETDAPFTAKDFVNKIFPNGWSFLINFLALIVLFVAVYFLAYKPVKKYVEARKDYVEHNLRDSERAKALNEAKVAEGDSIISDAKEQANAIVLKAKSDATLTSQSIVAEAEKDAQERQKAADEAIKQEEEKSRRAIHDEIVNVALDASKQVLGREVNDKDNAKLVSDFADDVKKEGKGA
jgi:F-type H+-transporting ATPase subunit b